MKDKSEVFQLFVNFYRIIQIQFGSPIKRLCSNNGRAYVNQNLSNFLKDNSVVYELTCVDALQQNGLQKEKIDISLRLPELYSSKCLFLNLTGGSCSNRYLLDK